MPLRMPEAARTPMTGIMEPVMTPMREEKPNLIQPTAVVGLGAASASESTSPPPRPGSWATMAS